MGNRVGAAPGRGSRPCHRLGHHRAGEGPSPVHDIIAAARKASTGGRPSGRENRSQGPGEICQRLIVGNSAARCHGLPAHARPEFPGIATSVARVRAGRRGAGSRYRGRQARMERLHRDSTRKDAGIRHKRRGRPPFFRPERVKRRPRLPCGHRHSAAYNGGKACVGSVGGTRCRNTLCGAGHHWRIVRGRAAPRTGTVEEAGGARRRGL